MSRSKPILGALLTAPFLLAACQSGGSTPMAPTPAIALLSIDSVVSGGINYAGDQGPFPLDVVGGDGYQANPTNDASFATLLTSVRTNAGVAPLTYNAQLDQAAQRHADDMFTNSFTGHIGSDGSTFQQRIAATGYVATAAGENVAQGQANENLVMNAWTSSPGHHSNNVNPAFEHFGLARSGTGNNIRWALVFGAD
ncbi:MAG: CAP domain-containing protein [Planktotalea sp.]|uniref:CAP domain-containing protein n=1 Tax=Planktotalea sp. TaxID=2029877 RepID=UPI003C794B7E